jgi:tetratricopeptide (TPR) repeat protein
VHPVLTESVTNIVGRADLLSGAGILGGLLLYLKSTDHSGWRRWAYLAGLSAVTAVGVFSKESAVMVLPVILLYEAIWWKQRRQVRGLIWGSLAMAAPIEVMLYLRSTVLWSAPAAIFPFYDNPIVGAGFVTGRLTAIQVIGKYAALLVWPARLSCDYSWAQIFPLGGGAVNWIVFAAMAAVVAAGVLFWRGSRSALFLAVAALLVFLPTSNLLFPIGTIMAERFLYLPSIAFAAAVVSAVVAVGKRARSERLVPVLLGLILIALAARTWVRNQDWQDDVSIGRAAVQASPASFKSHKLLADALHESDAGHANIDAVIEEAEKGLAPLNALPDVRNNADSYLRTGGYYAERGERLRQSAPQESAKAYRRALELLQRSRVVARAQTNGEPDPARFAALMLRISEVYRRLGENDHALEAAMEGRRMEPENTEMHHQIAAILLDQGKSDEAAAALMEGVLLTTDTGLRNELLRLYQSGLDRLGCATMLVPGNTALNRECAIVHRHLCAASVGTMRLRVETGRQDLAEQMKQTAMKDFGCSAESLEK